MVFKKKIDYQFRKALTNEKDQIWRILKDAIHRRKKDNSNQWQDGYPNRNIIQNDLDQGYGFVLTTNDQIIGYCALLINDEPEYLKINGKWLSNKNFIVFHRLAIGKEFLNNHDNIPMLKLFKSLGYSFCGIVHFRDSPRKAFEKLLNN